MEFADFKEKFFEAHMNILTEKLEEFDEKKDNDVIGYFEKVIDIFMKLDDSNNSNKDAFIKINQNSLKDLKKYISHFKVEYRKRIKGFLKMHYQINAINMYLKPVYNGESFSNDQFKMKSSYDLLNDLEKEMDIRLNQLGYMDDMVDRINEWIEQLQMDEDYLENMKKIQNDYTHEKDKY